MNAHVKKYQKAVNARKGNLGPMKGPTGTFRQSRRVNNASLAAAPLYAIPSGDEKRVYASPQPFPELSTLEYSILRKIN
jgi:hypothetical protein